METNLIVFPELGFWVHQTPLGGLSETGRSAGVLIYCTKREAQLEVQAAFRTLPPATR